MPLLPGETSMSYELDEYAATLDNLASNHDNFNYVTISPETAAISIAKIMQYSKKEVKIYDDSLTGDIGEAHPIFVETLAKFLENGKLLKILLRKDEEAHSPFFDRLAEMSKDFPMQIDLRFASIEFSNALKKTFEKDLNFTVSDNDSYRVEAIEQVDNSNKTAFCNFNNADLADQLNSIFDSLFHKCNVHPIPEFS